MERLTSFPQLGLPNAEKTPNNHCITGQTRKHAERLVLDALVVPRFLCCFCFFVVVSLECLQSLDSFLIEMGMLHSTSGKSFYDLYYQPTDFTIEKDLLKKVLIREDELRASAEIQARYSESDDN